MQHLTTQLTAIAAALFIATLSISAVINVPPAHASIAAPMLA